jgi:hypothetical protein
MTGTITMTHFLIAFALLATGNAWAQESPVPGPETAAKQPIKVEIVESGGKYQLLRGGKPYAMRGAGIDHSDLEVFAAHGGNSFRTWAVDDGPLPARELLDKAHALGLTVSLCLEFDRERHGFDYNDAAAVARQKEETRARVMANKDHPALLTWIIGNELNFDYDNPKVFDAVNVVSKMIHEIDPNHPTTTALAGADKRVMRDVQERASDLDFLSFQLYADVVNLPKYIERSDYKGPYFVTEWGAVGHWEVFKTRWDAPVEQTSSEKAASYANSYLKVIQEHGDQIIGNYVFLWGQKQERTGTWYGMFTEDGSSTEAVDVMHYIWNNKWPDNRAPRISRVSLDGQVGYDNVTLWKGNEYKAEVNAVDSDNDTLTYHWVIREESKAKEIGGDKEVIPPVIEGMISSNSGPEITMKAPEEGGAYRLFVYVSDGNNNMGHSNTPFYVK